MMTTMTTRTKKMALERGGEAPLQRAESWRPMSCHRPITSVGLITFLVYETDLRNNVCPAEKFIFFSKALSCCVLFSCASVLSCGTKGIPQSGVGFRMNVGKLESRMLCRRLERDGVIKVRPKLSHIQTFSLLSK